MTNGITGLWVAALTPLTAQGSVDHAHLATHADWLFQQGVDGLVLFGTTGEGTAFSANERLDTVAALMKHGIPAARLAIGAGFPALPDSIALAKDALALGLQHMLFLPPYFYRDVDPAGVEAAFATIIDSVADDRLRATLYHIPQVSGVGITPATLASLRHRFGPLLAGLKDSTGSFDSFLAFRAADPDVCLTVGNEADIGRAVAAGGQGTICGMVNIVPDMVRAMFTDPAAAGPMQRAIDLMRGPFVPLLKAGMAEMMEQPAWNRVRPPLLPASMAEGRRLASGLQALRHAAAA